MMETGDRSSREDISHIDKGTGKMVVVTENVGIQKRILLNDHSSVQNTLKASSN